MRLIRAPANAHPTDFAVCTLSSGSLHRGLLDIGEDGFAIEGHGLLLAIKLRDLLRLFPGLKRRQREKKLPMVLIWTCDNLCKSLYEPRSLLLRSTVSACTYTGSRSHGLGLSDLRPECNKISGKSRTVSKHFPVLRVASSERCLRTNAGASETR